MKLFCSGYIEIKTFDGPKWIKDVKVGDLVLTHLNRYKRVSKIIKLNKPRKYRKSIFDIYFLVEDETRKGGYREEGIHRIVENHLVFCSSRKKQVKDIKQGDLINIAKGMKGRVVLLLEIPENNHSDFLHGLEIENDHSYYADNVCVND